MLVKLDKLDGSINIFITINDLEDAETLISIINRKSDGWGAENGEESPPYVQNHDWEADG